LIESAGIQVSGFFQKDGQKAVDAALIKAIEDVPDLKTYLGLV